MKIFQYAIAFLLILNTNNIFANVVVDQTVFEGDCILSVTESCVSSLGAVAVVYPRLGLVSQTVKSGETGFLEGIELYFNYTDSYYPIKRNFDISIYSENQLISKSSTLYEPEPNGGEYSGGMPTWHYFQSVYIDFSFDEIFFNSGDEWSFTASAVCEREQQLLNQCYPTEDNWFLGYYNDGYIEIVAYTELYNSSNLDLAFRTFVDVDETPSIFLSLLALGILICNRKRTQASGQRQYCAKPL